MVPENIRAPKTDLVAKASDAVLVVHVAVEMGC